MKKFARYFVLLLVIFTVSCGDVPFEKHNAGAVELWVGDRVRVETECRRRGAVASNDAAIYGCADFSKRVIISVSDPKVIAHEFCHWTLYTADHALCRTPLMGRN